MIFSIFCKLVRSENLLSMKLVSTIGNSEGNELDFHMKFINSCRFLLISSLFDISTYSSKYTHIYQHVRNTMPEQKNSFMWNLLNAILRGLVYSVPAKFDFFFLWQWPDLK